MYGFLSYFCLSGGVTQFAAKEDTVAKWVMNRPYQAKFVESLFEMTGIAPTMSNLRKCLRPSEVLKSNRMVENMITTLNAHFINPFSLDLNRNELYNLVSGYPVQEIVSSCLLGLQTRGEELMSQFEDRITTEMPEEKFFSPISREPLKTFKDSTVKTTVKKHEN